MAIISQVSQVLLSATTVAATFCPAAAATARLTVPAGTAAAAAAAAATSLCRSTAAVGSSQSIRSACHSLPLSLYLSYSLPHTLFLPSPGQSLVLAQSAALALGHALLVTLFAFCRLP